MTIEKTVLSDCQVYRYQLHRSLGKPGTRSTPAVFIMLNPSTADAEKDDPTIRRCMRFAQSWGHSSLVVFNLFAFRATYPTDLEDAGYPVGPANDAYLNQIHKYTDTVVCAWGGLAPLPRVLEVARLLKSNGLKLMCLGETKSHMPKHPLYLKGDTKLVEWLMPPQMILDMETYEDDEI